MLKISHLSKKYKTSKHYSVKDLSFEAKEGEIFGFLGKNGAGKSTTIKCITGIIPFEEGKIEVCGYDISKNPIEAKLNIGYVPDNHAVYENLTGREYVTYMGNIYKVSKDKIIERINKFSKLFSMEHALDNQIRSYSHGMHQKICIIAALIHNPKDWVLDEPLMGLDPQSAFEIREYMKEHKKKGNTVFFSSHNIDMVEKLCDRVAIINKGQLLEVIDVKEFLKTSKVSLEEYFLTMTKDKKLKEIYQNEQEASKKLNKLRSFLKIKSKKSKKQETVKKTEKAKKLEKIKKEKTKEKKVKTK